MKYTRKSLRLAEFRRRRYKSQREFYLAFEKATSEQLHPNTVGS